MPNESTEDMEYNNEKKVYYQRLLKKAGIFCGILVFFFCFLLLFVVLAKSSWRTGLANQIQKVFEINGITQYSVGEYVRIKSPMTVNCAVYKANSVTDENTNPKNYAVIIRFPTIFGPVAGVYLYREKKHRVDFVDFAQINGPVSDAIKDSAMRSQVEYWADKIPAIVNNAVVETNKVNVKTKKGGKSKK